MGMNSLKGFRSFTLRDQVQLRPTVRAAARYSVNEGRPFSDATLFITVRNMGDVDAKFKFQTLTDVDDTELDINIYNPWNPIEPTPDHRVTVDFNKQFQKAVATDLEVERGTSTNSDTATDLTLVPRGQGQYIVKLPGSGGEAADVAPFLQVVSRGTAADQARTRILLEIESNIEIGHLHHDEDLFNLFVSIDSGGDQEFAANGVPLLDASNVVAYELSGDGEHTVEIDRITGGRAIATVALNSGLCNFSSALESVGGSNTRASMTVGQVRSDVLVDVTTSA